MPRTKEDWINQLGLQSHPEGGWYQEVYRADESINQSALPARFTGARAFSTAIYYLLGPGDFSALHRIRQDEVWHFYDGSPLAIKMIRPSGQAETLLLGRDPKAGALPMAVVPAGSWFGARVTDSEGYTLAGCTVAPGFDFDDFEMPSRDELLAKFPQHRELIESLTH